MMNTSIQFGGIITKNRIYSLIPCPDFFAEYNFMVSYESASRSATLQMHQMPYGLSILFKWFLSLIY